MWRVANMVGLCPVELSLIAVQTCSTRGTFWYQVNHWTAGSNRWNECLAITMITSYKQPGVVLAPCRVKHGRIMAKTAFSQRGGQRYNTQRLSIHANDFRHQRRRTEHRLLVAITRFLIVQLLVGVLWQWTGPVYRGWMRGIVLNLVILALVGILLVFVNIFTLLIYWFIYFWFIN